MNEHEERILEFIKTHDRPASDAEIKEKFPYLSNSQRVVVMNTLLKRGLIKLLCTADKKVAYEIEAPCEDVECLKGASNEEKVVYSIIKESGNQGIWIKDIRQKSNLNQTPLNEIIKNLLNKKAIKLFKSVKAVKKKIYMLYDSEPDKSLTGGPWYNEQEFDSDFVDVLSQHCYNFLERKKQIAMEAVGSPMMINNNSFASVTEIWKFIEQLGIIAIKLCIDDIETILRTLIYDGKVERKLTAGGGNLYKAFDPLLPSPGLARTPCGICPIFKNCDLSGTANPKSCSYYNEWLL